ncbi:hypothetical protein [Hydrogenophaga sp.]|uniref:hypothetical protein n=1 Tax=Hydrogenophaga sp. TaxID=1904254 RepID=UPI0025C17675|nr:hypothetical protein [Hydrogenophaga sp.]
MQFWTVPLSRGAVVPWMEAAEYELKGGGMWLLVAREPRANASYWTGRRWFSALDAVAWPMVWVLLVSQFDVPVGIVGPMVVAIALLFSAERIHRAVWVNHRYWFTTWRWGRIVIALMVIGLVLKFTVSA